VIAVDTNILVYTHREDSPFHEAAFRRLAELAEGAASWAIPWPCLHEFLAIVTHPRVYAPPTPLAHALDQVDAWLESPTVVLLAESATHWPTLRAILARGRVVGGQIHDGRVAALCLQHGVRELWSADRDFSRFAGLAAVNPLVGDRPTRRE
jgi:toxin-antitoxin system PIN domain toxin